MTNILWFTEIGMADVAQVGGKNALWARWSRICRMPE